MAAARVARASSCAFSISLAMPIFLMYFSASPSARMRDVAGVQLDSPPRRSSFLLEIEVVVRQGGGFAELPRFRADRHERQAGRDHEGLLRTADHNVESPAIDVERHRADSGDCIHDEDRIGVFDQSADGLDIMLGAGRGLGSLKENAFGAGLGLERASTRSGVTTSPYSALSTFASSP